MSAEGLSLRGVITALVTPLDEDGRVAEKALEQLVEFQVRAGVQGLSPCGTTGEHALLTFEERQRVAEVVVRAAEGRVPVFVQTGAPSTEMTIALTRHAQRIGAHAVTIVTPYYFRLTDEALIQHYVRVAESIPDFPMYLYNIPQLTGTNLSSAVVHTLADRCPNIVGMKDSSGNLAQIIDSAAARDGRFNIAIGSDGLLLSAAVAGIPAAISGSANVCPELFVDFYKAFWRGDLAAAQAAQGRIHHVRRVLKDGGDLSLFKALLAHRGIDAGEVRLPLLSAPKGVVDQSIRSLIEQGVELSAAAG